MAVPDFAQHVTAASFAAGERAHNLSYSNAPSAKGGDGAGRLSFDDLLDIVNPLQHIPVVSTVYRAVTGDKMGDAAEVIGGGLYGGLMGLGSSLLDVAFKDVTGKTIGDTVMAWLGMDSPTDTKIAAADGKPAQSASAQPSSAASQAKAEAPGAQALLAAADVKGVDPALSARALFAYRQSIGMHVPPPALAD